MDAALVTAIGGLVSGGFGAYWTAKTFYLKRQDELRERQRSDLAQMQALQQQELDRAREETERQKAERQKELEAYAEGQTKKYAAERDFQHLMRQYETLSHNLNTLHKLSDRRLDGVEDDLRDIKGLLQMIAVALGQSETGIQRYLTRDDDKKTS